MKKYKMKYKKGDIIEEDDLKWKITYLHNYYTKGYQFVVAHRLKNDGTLGVEAITFDSDRYNKTFHRYKNLPYEK